MSEPPALPAVTGYLADAFDLLNVRDLDLIAQARSLCDHLVLGVYTDDYAQQTTGRRPIVPLHERSALLTHVRGVDAVVVHEELGLSRPTDARWFAVAGQVEPGCIPFATLWPRRETQGAVLREVLSRSGAEEAVA